MNKFKTEKIGRLENTFYFWSGAIILVLNKFRHEIKGYLNARTFPSSQIDQVIKYDISVFSSWLSQLKSYSGSDNIAEKTVLELGPGSDIGISLCFLARNAKKYFALDKFKLIDQAPDELYEKLIDTISINKDQNNNLKSEYNLFKKNKSERIKYIHDSNFSLNKFADKKIDLIVSQAAFEHFTNPAQVIEEMGVISQKGTTAVVQIDMMTHTRWITGQDPLNIYRYSDWFYKLTSFSGSPNRWRPDDYVLEFKKAGFKNIKIVPIQTLSDSYFSSLKPHLSKKFSNKPQMNILDCYLLATKE